MIKERFLFLFIILLGSLFSVAARAENVAFPDPTQIGQGWGVQVRSDDVLEEDFEKIKNIGFDFVRFDLDWDKIEGERGAFNWDYSDRLIKWARSRNLKPVIILMGFHPLYTGFVEPIPGRSFWGAETTPAALSNPEEIHAFSVFLRKLVQRYGGEDIIWEIWNEPDSDDFWPPYADPEMYAQVASEACRVIREEAPTSVIVGPATARMPGVSKGYLEDFYLPFLVSPAVSCLSAISMHTHRFRMRPETVSDDYGTVLQYIEAHKSQDAKMPTIIDSEWGYTTAISSEDEQADYALRTQLINKINGIPVTIWYEFKDSELSYAPKSDRENHFGLHSHDGVEKLSAKVVASFLPRIKDAVYLRRINVGDPESYVLLGRQPTGEHLLIVWRASKANVKRSTLRIEEEQGIQRIPLNGRPQLIHIETPSPTCRLSKGDD